MVVLSLYRKVQKYNKIKDKNKPVKFLHQNRLVEEVEIDIDEVIENPDHVLIGNDIPVEYHEFDYKYD